MTVVAPAVHQLMLLIRMPSFAKSITRILLARLLRKSCPPTIPRSGEEGAAQNCYLVFVKNDSERFFVAKEINEHSLIGLVCSEREFEYPASVPVSLLSARDIEIIHYYGLATVSYSGLWDYVINGLTGKEYIKIRLLSTFSVAVQYTF